MDHNIPDNQNAFTVCYSDNIHSSDYITQFLNFSNIDDHQHNLNDAAKIEPLQVPKQENVTSEDVNNNFFNPTQDDSKNKTNFHNFQKHLVTTLRHTIDIAQVQNKWGPQSVQSLLWKYFMSCSKLTRTLVYLIYGKLSTQISKVRKYNRQYGLQKLLKSYPLSEIKKAQQNLRDETLRQTEKINFEWQMQNRRMKNKQQFRKYFQAFLEQLKQGRFNKRIPKEKKLKVQQISQKENIKGGKQLFNQQLKI